MNKQRRFIITKQDKMKMQEWILKNGGCSFEEDGILFNDGGLFSIEEKEIMLPKILGDKEIKGSKNRQVVFSKKLYPHKDYQVAILYCELDEMINYLKRMKGMLNGLKIQTGYTICKLRGKVE